MSDERRQKLEERRAWLEQSVTGLRRNYERSPKFAALLLLVVPAWLLGGGLLAFFVAFMVVVFVSVLIYVAWSHVHENEAELRSVRTELDRMPPESPRAA